MSINNNFYGREDEILSLVESWDRITSKNTLSEGPKMHIILGETGIGKTRLIQSFYERICNQEIWNPKESNYWPKSFLTGNQVLDVNPISNNLNFNHIPNGPPKFMWLGCRWQPNDLRNIEIRDCVLPFLRSTLSSHLQLTRKNLPIWLKTKSISGNVLKNYDLSDASSLEDILDIIGENLFAEIIPFASLLYKTIKTGRQTIKSEVSFTEQFNQSNVTQADQFLKEFSQLFGTLGSGGITIPTVLWLDDAHWIDEVSLSFLHKLWSKAVENKWPLFIIVTHWEREWNLLKQKNDESSLIRYKDKSYTLDPADYEDLDCFIKDCLPGITISQKELLIEKSDGNYLTLTENLSNLIKQPGYFIDRNLSKQLTNAAELVINNWESNREKRIEQRFLELQPELQEILGWSSQLGRKFIKEILIEVGYEFIDLKPEYLEKILNDCIDPYAILDKTSEILYSYRDVSYYNQSKKYYENIIVPQNPNINREYLDSFWINVSKRMINSAFKSNGALITNENTKGFSITQLEKEEQVTLLRMLFYKVPKHSLKEESELSKLSIRLRYLYFRIMYGYNNTLEDYVTDLFDVDWIQIPLTVISIDDLKELATLLMKSGYCDLAIRMFHRVLQEEVEHLNEYDPKKGVTFTKIAICIYNTMDTTEGKNAALNMVFLAIRIFGRQPAAHDFELADSILLSSYILSDIGKKNNALESSLLALKIFSDIENISSEELLPVSHSLATIYYNLENWEEALKYFKLCLSYLEKIPFKSSFPNSQEMVYDCIEKIFILLDKLFGREKVISFCNSYLSNLAKESSVNNDLFIMSVILVMLENIGYKRFQNELGGRIIKLYEKEGKMDLVSIYSKYLDQKD